MIHQLWFDHRRQHEQTTLNLQGLHHRNSTHNQTPASKEGTARMILPGHLNTILSLYPRNHGNAILLLDLRSSTDFERSHISSAINLRCPVSFIHHASLEMVEDTFTDVSSRHAFNNWYQSRCIVIYDRCIEFDWECPVANALLTKFRGKKGWKGQCFILKGHYREFADSFDQWITGKGKGAASEASSEQSLGVGTGTSQYHDTTEERDREYEQWLKNFDESGEGLGGRRITELGPAKREERARAVDQRQKEWEREFETRFPALWRKAVAMRGQHEREELAAAAAVTEGETLGRPQRRGMLEDGASTTSTQPDDLGGNDSVSPPQSPPPPPFSSTTEPYTAADTPTRAARSSQQFQGGGGGGGGYDKAQLVGPLVGGLQKMWEASGLVLGSMSQQDPAASGASPSGYHQDAYYASVKADYHDYGGGVLTNDYSDYNYEGIDPISESWQGVGAGGGGMVSGTVSPMPPEWQHDESGMSSNYGGGAAAETATESERGGVGAKKVKKRTQLPLWERLRGSAR